MVIIDRYEPRLAVVSSFESSFVPPPWSPCLRGESFLGFIHHGDTEHTEEALTKTKPMTQPRLSTIELDSIGEIS